VFGIELTICGSENKLATTSTKHQEPRIFPNSCSLGVKAQEIPEPRTVCIRVRGFHRLGLQLQRVLNAAARLVLKLGPRDHVSAAMHELHWLPIWKRIDYKLCLLAHNVRIGHVRE
jgi:hypothetical protein